MRLRIQYRKDTRAERVSAIKFVAIEHSGWAHVHSLFSPLSCTHHIAELLDIHTGFSLYMLRRRKDTQMNKIEEILQKVDAIGREMAPDGDYKLSITGHSLGGALATLLGE
jgi:alpha-beta hydrolase superfamily lysophospholipase